MKEYAGPGTLAKLCGIIKRALAGLENTVIKDVVGDRNIDVTIGTDRTASVSLNKVVSVNVINLNHSDSDKHTSISYDTITVDGEEQKGFMADEDGELAPILVPTPEQHNDAVPLYYLTASREEIESSIRGVEGEAMAAKTVANAAATSAATALDKANQAEASAASAKTVADGALQRSGGEMTGPITLPTNNTAIKLGYSGVGVFNGKITPGTATSNGGILIGITNGIPYLGFNSTNVNIVSQLRTKIRGVATPTEVSDAANKEYVDAQVAAARSAAAPTAATFPGGFVAMFLATTELPEGWTLCNGQWGTPDLMSAMPTTFGGVDIVYAMKV